MASNKKFTNAIWRDVSKQQEKISSDFFLKLQDLLGKDFQGMSMDFSQLSGECSYTFETIHYSYTMLLNRKGTIIQEHIEKKS
jgi:hypothetical protein